MEKITVKNMDSCTTLNVILDSMLLDVAFVDHELQTALLLASMEVLIFLVLKRLLLETQFQWIVQMVYNMTPAFVINLVLKISMELDLFAGRLYQQDG